MKILKASLWRWICHFIMVFLSIAIWLWGDVVFWHLEKYEKLLTLVVHPSTHQPLHRLRVASVSDCCGVKIVSSCHLMRLDVLFVSGWPMYENNIWFDANLIFFFPFISLSSESIFTLSMEYITTTLKLLFFLDSISVLFQKITSNWKVF
jgi:hypothetical protein